MRLRPIGFALRRRFIGLSQLTVWTPAGDVVMGILRKLSTFMVKVAIVVTIYGVIVASGSALPPKDHGEALSMRRLTADTVLPFDCTNYKGPIQATP